MLGLLCLAIMGVPPGTFDVDREHSNLTYHVVHKLHRVEATSRQLEGRAIIAPDGKAQTMLRVAVASFKSGDANRDEHMLEAMQAQRFPSIILKGRFNVAATAGDVTTVALTVTAELELAGKKEQLQVPVSVELDGNSARVKGTLHFSLDRFGIERPALLFVKIDDDCAVDLDVRFERVHS